MGDLVRGWYDIRRRASNEGQASEYRDASGTERQTRATRFGGFLMAMYSKDGEGGGSLRRPQTRTDGMGALSL